MMLLDVISLTAIVLTVMHAQNPRQSSNEIVQAAIMGSLGAITGAMAASMLFGVQVAALRFENILMAAVALLFVLFLGRTFPGSVEGR